MGCGTGPLSAMDSFKITLRFQPRIPPNMAIYTNFESAVRGFLRERLDTWTPGLSGGKVETVKVVMHGPIQTEEEQKQFNRAMNRLLWGVRMVCSDAAGGGDPAPSGFQVQVDTLQKNNQPSTGPDWTFEDTCNNARKMLSKKATAKRKPAAKGKTAAKRKTRGKY